jgi:hypothetical protein
MSKEETALLVRDVALQQKGLATSVYHDGAAMHGARGSPDTSVRDALSIGYASSKGRVLQGTSGTRDESYKGRVVQRTCLTRDLSYKGRIVQGCMIQGTQRTHRHAILLFVSQKNDRTPPNLRLNCV